jgi:hypothetical protein
MNIYHIIRAGIFISALLAMSSYGVVQNEKADNKTVRVYNNSKWFVEINGQMIKPKVDTTIEAYTPPGYSSILHIEFFQKDPYFEKTVRGGGKYTSKLDPWTVFRFPANEIAIIDVTNQSQEYQGPYVVAWTQEDFDKYYRKTKSEL